MRATIHCDRRFECDRTRPRSTTLLTRTRPVYGTESRKDAPSLASAKRRNAEPKSGHIDGLRLRGNPLDQAGKHSAGSDLDE